MNICKHAGGIGDVILDRLNFLTPNTGVYRHAPHIDKKLPFLTAKHFSHILVGVGKEAHKGCDITQSSYLSHVFCADILSKEKAQERPKQERHNLSQARQITKYPGSHY